ncbi:hypothetical protein F4818DRAFT_68151 [Hypoxylon cercidicola]|nr:hypothetical protein F4818DRAFT_68151 [Hypoxylon cercidicola]
MPFALVISGNISLVLISAASFPVMLSEFCVIEALAVAMAAMRLCVCAPFSPAHVCTKLQLACCAVWRDALATVSRSVRDVKTYVISMPGSQAGHAPSIRIRFTITRLDLEPLLGFCISTV